MSRHAHEAALEPDLPIIDPHHHLWDLRPHLAHVPRGHALMDGLRDTPCYQLEDLVRDASKGHDVRATVYMECGSSYRPDGPEELRPVGEVEFANRIAEQSVARGKFRACAGIVDTRISCSATPWRARSKRGCPPLRVASKACGTWPRTMRIRRCSGRQAMRRRTCW